jgi:hypothetical protein
MYICGKCEGAGESPATDSQMIDLVWEMLNEMRLCDAQADQTMSAL